MVIKKIKPTISDWLKYLFLGFLSTPLYLYLYSLGVNMSSAIDVSLISIVVPIFIIIGGAIFLHENITKREIFGTILAIAGTMVLTIFPFSILKNFSSKNILGLLQDNGELYFYNTLSGTLEKKGESVRQFSFSPSGAWTAILGEKTLEVFSKNDDYARLNLSAYPYINSISWYRDENHLLLNLYNGMGLLDFSAVNPENIQHLASSINASYDADGNILYYALSDKVWSLEIPK